MGEQIIKQPDGKLAVFDSMVDDFTMWDATPQELIEWRAERAAEEARKLARLYIDRVLSGEPRPYAQFTMTWDEAVERAEHNPMGTEGEWE